MTELAAIGESLTTNRYGVFKYGLASLTAIGGLCIALGTKSDMVLAVMGTIASVVSAALGFGNLHDLRVRTAAITAKKEVEISHSQDLARVSASQDLPRTP